MTHLFFLTRPWFWLPAIGSALSGFLYDGSYVVSLGNLLPLLITIGPGLAAFAEVFNDICDVSRDKISTQHRILGISLAGGSGILTGGRISLRKAKSICALSAAIAFFVSLTLGRVVTLFTVFGLFSAFLYSIPQFRGKDKPFVGQLLLGLGYGPISFHIGFFSSGANCIHLSGIIAGLLIGLWVVVIGITADVLDIDDSLRLGQHNLAVILGKNFALLASAIGGFALLFSATLLFILSNISIRYFLFLPVLIFSVWRGVALLRNPDIVQLRRLHFIAICLETAFPLSLKAS